MKSRPLAAALFHAGTQTDGRTGISMLIVRFPSSLLDLNKI